MSHLSEINLPIDEQRIGRGESQNSSLVSLPANPPPLNDDCLHRTTLKEFFPLLHLSSESMVRERGLAGVLLGGATTTTGLFSPSKEISIADLDRFYSTPSLHSSA